MLFIAGQQAVVDSPEEEPGRTRHPFGQRHFTQTESLVNGEQLRERPYRNFDPQGLEIVRNRPQSVSVRGLFKPEPTATVFDNAYILF